jgi:flagellar biosynthetic protein FlhB
MADDAQDESQRTEEPTQRRLDEALKKGQIPFSREVPSFFLLATFTLLVAWLLPKLSRETMALLSAYIEHPDQIPMDTGGLGLALLSTLKGAFLILLIPLFATLAAALIAGFMQNHFIFTFEPLMPDLGRISPARGLSRLFSLRSVIELLKGIIKLTIIGGIAAYTVLPHLAHIKQLPDSSMIATMAFTWETVKEMLIAVCIIMFFIAIGDYLYQRFEYIKGLRMSKQEIRDEFKQQEGDPAVKQRIRQIRMERARKRMMAAVPAADVVITNPTHFAVALQYDNKTMRAPKVVAKGADNIALNIRRIAEENDIPIVENPPLAQALYATADLDREIPVEHYKAVAEVIGYVYRLKGKGRRAA